MKERKKKHYWTGIDLWKGILIIFVFISHIIPGEIRDSFGRYLIYSFHMPLFIGISGFLLNLYDFRYDLKKIFHRLFFRIVLPWMIVVLLYNLANNQGRLIWRDLIHSYVWPYYHLWYVTAYLAYYLFTIFLWKITEKFGAYRIWILLAFAAILSLCSKFQIWQYFTLPYMLLKLLEYAEHDFKMFYYIFFAVGAVARYQYEIGQERVLTGIINQKDKTGNRLRKTNQYVWLTLGCSLSLTIVIILFFDDLPFFEYMAGYCWGILLLLLVLTLIQENKLPINRFLTFIGRNSYPIYLYHAFILIYFKSAFLNTDVRYYVLLTALFIVLCILVYFLKKIKWVDRYLFGNLKV